MPDAETPLQHSRDFLREAYRRMATIRRFEERVHELFAAGKLPGFVHLYAGEEASAVGICSQLDERDAITSTHRGHGHCIAKGCDVTGMMKELYGKAGGLCAGAEQKPVPMRPQTRAVFTRLKEILAPYQATIRDHCVRTWIYVRDVDLFYQDMVAERREVFAEEGLTPATHFIASTGIGGACSHRYDLVAMDSYAIAGLRAEQVRYLNDFSRLNAPKEYGVSFERATEVRYADRRHVFLSGTASIDRNGDVVHVGDAEAQLDRALDNAAGLLAQGDARLEDLLYLLVYLRDPADAPRLERRLERALPDVPRILLHAPVCRPQWLVEIEGVAAVRAEESGLPRF